MQKLKLNENGKCKRPAETTFLAKSMTDHQGDEIKLVSLEHGSRLFQYLQDNDLKRKTQLNIGYESFSTNYVRLRKLETFQPHLH